MARIELVEVAHSYQRHPRGDEDFALKPTTLVWEDGSANAILGPSGCGKTTLLNIISGLVRPTRGRVLFNGQEVTGLDAARRNIAQVFQFPVVYDTMSTRDNLAFPLRNRKVPEAEVRRRVEDVAAMLGLEEALDRSAGMLGADAKQKLSLGRGLVRQDVAAILLDEPLTVIDPHVKWHLRRKLKEAHEQSRVTMIYVTHDQHEALTFADQVCVMRDGRIVQQGPPEALHEDPADAFVGYFIGSPGMNLFPVEVTPAGASAGGQVFGLPPATLARAREASGPFRLGIRPEFVRLARPGEPDALPARVRAVEDLGSHKIGHVAVGDLVLKLKVDGDAQLAAGGEVWLCFPASRLRLYAGGGQVVR